MNDDELHEKLSSLRKELEQKTISLQNRSDKIMDRVQELFEQHNKEHRELDDRIHTNELERVELSTTLNWIKNKMSEKSGLSAATIIALSTIIASVAAFLGNILVALINKVP